MKLKPKHTCPDSQTILSNKWIVTMVINKVVALAMNKVVALAMNKVVMMLVVPAMMAKHVRVMQMTVPAMTRAVIYRMQADFVRKRPALKHRYIDPSPIASTNFNYPKEWKLDCKELGGGKTLKGKEDIRNKKILEESLKVAAYIALCFKNLQQHDNIWIPCHFNDHWICIGVWLSHSMAWVFDSADFPVETYKDFIAIVKTAFRHYVQKHKRRHHPNRKEKWYVKTLCACPKQKPGSLHCGYYTCIMMSTIGGYSRNPNLLEKDKDTRRNPYKNDELLEMVGDLCNFIMDQIVYHKSTYYHLLSDLGSNSLYQHLRETDRLALGR
ncbi:uncharacterized protein [Miscanthus floridulus]|uniref:uncharacterized protein isoform X3 n=1 Tax=Miscanthus floridulus TaxID=154761 RepID=UPI0034576CC7